MTEEEKREVERCFENAAREAARSEVKEALKWLEEFKKRHPRPKRKKEGKANDEQQQN